MGPSNVPVKVRALEQDFQRFMANGFPDSKKQFVFCSSSTNRNNSIHLERGNEVMDSRDDALSYGCYI